MGRSANRARSTTPATTISAVENTTLAGIEYAGLAGISQECKDAVLRLIQFGEGTNEGERNGRMNLFIGAYMAYRNPRAHRESKDRLGAALAEFLLLNHLYMMEKQSIEDNAGAGDGNPSAAIT
jgi:hypothetical protein